MHENNLFRINTGLLLNQPVGAYREFDIDVSNIEDESKTVFEDVHATVRISRVQQGILVSVKASATTEIECCRCLDPFQQTVSCEFDELYAFHLRQNADADTYLPESGVIDILPLLLEYLTIEIPIKPICKPECRGLCIECGQNLNRGICEHVIKEGQAADGT